MNTLRIVADENIPLVRETFGHLGEVICRPGRSITNSDLQGADILLVRSVTSVRRQLLEGTAVRFVGSATIGTDHIDATYLCDRGIHWSAAPGSNADSVVEYVISALCRLDGVLEQLLQGATVGIVGMGNVGARLYQRLAALGINCRGYDPLIDQNRFPILTDLETVLESEVLCLHTPLARSGSHPSFHLIDEARLQQLCPGTVLINAGRGAVIDGRALLSVLRQRKDLAVVLDVWEQEPDIDLELLRLVDLATPHIAGYSYDGKLAGTTMIHRACCQFFDVPLPDAGQLPAGDDGDRQFTITVGSQQSEANALREAVRQVYDIAVDDQRLRGALWHRGSETVAAVFDRLRRTYPQRREFCHYQVKPRLTDPSRHRATGVGDDKKIMQLLRGLGFNPDALSG